MCCRLYRTRKDAVRYAMLMRVSTILLLQLLRHLQSALELAGSGFADLGSLRIQLVHSLVLPQVVQ